MRRGREVNNYEGHSPAPWYWHHDELLDENGSRVLGIAWNGDVAPDLNCNAPDRELIENTPKLLAQRNALVEALEVILGAFDRFDWWGLPHAKIAAEKLLREIDAEK